MSRIGIAVIGLGPAAEPHAKSLVDLADRVDVRWAVTRSQARAEQAAARYPFPVTTDLDQALADKTVQAVLVLTPPGAHLQLAERCFAAGKHVLVEKPLELSAERARQLVAAGRASGLRLGVVLQHRFRPGAVRLRALLADGALGEVAAGWVTVPWWRPQAYYDEPGRGTLARDGGGVLLTQAIHALDLFRSLLGVSEVVSAMATTTRLHRMETEDYVTAQFRLGNGAPGMLAATTAFSPGRPERIERFGGARRRQPAGRLSGRFGRDAGCRRADRQRRQHHGFPERRAPRRAGGFSRCGGNRARSGGDRRGSPGDPGTDRDGAGSERFSALKAGRAA
jgi:predicted dehydrogenase